MFLEIAVMTAAFWVFLQKKPDTIQSFRIVDEVRPTVSTPGEVTFHWTASKGAASYTLQLYFLSTWTTTIEGLEVTYDDNIAVMKYDSVTTNQEDGRPNIIFNIRANATDRKFFRETDKTRIRHELKGPL